jgi:hypothetical protein
VGSGTLTQTRRGRWRRGPASPSPRSPTGSRTGASATERRALGGEHQILFDNSHILFTLCMNICPRRKTLKEEGRCGDSQILSLQFCRSLLKNFSTYFFPENSILMDKKSKMSPFSISSPLYIVFFLGIILFSELLFTTLLYLFLSFFFILFLAYQIIYPYARPSFDILRNLSVINMATFPSIF